MKILLTPVLNVKAKEHFKGEIISGELPNRWSGPKKYNIDETCKYFAYLLPMTKDAKSRILLIYPIIGYTNTNRRKEWEDEYKECQTVFYGDLLAIVPWDEFLEYNNNEYHHISGTCTHELKSNWLDTLIESKEQDIDSLIALADIPISIEEIKKSFNHSDRYELIAKTMLDIEFPGVFTHNETIQTESKTYRPDFYALTMKFVLVIEYDENNHQSYDHTNELTRMNHIRSYMNNTYNLPTVIIRYGNKYQRWSDVQSFIEQVRNYLKIGNAKAPLLRGGVKKIETGYPDTIVLVGYAVDNAYNTITDWNVVRL